LAKIERQIAKLDGTEARLHGDLAANATDHERVTALDAELQGVRAEKAELEHRWMELAEEVG
jgi:ATP-binding cassette subfamily F protein uup